MGFLAEAVELFRAEQRLKRGEMTPDEFLDLQDGMDRSGAAFRFFRATALAVLHLPVIELPWLVAMATLGPVLAAVFLTGPGGLRTVFAFYVAVRVVVGVQDVGLMTWAHRSGYIPFNSSLTGTVVGTLPYPYAYAVGPAAWTVVEITLYLLLYRLPGLLGPLEQVVPGLISAVTAFGILQIAVHTIVRGGVNLLIYWEMPRLSDPDTFHRIRSVLWRTKNRLLGRSYAEVHHAERLWQQLKGDLHGSDWDDLDGQVEELPTGSARERVKSYLLASRKDEMILRDLLAPRS